MKPHGFTLVELAIVIVIIGLLVGGVVQGQELIKQAQIRKHAKRITEINAGIYTFYGKYNFIPGDYPAHLAANSLGTSGGNGDGKIEWNSGARDTYYFWQHLAVSNILKVSSASSTPYTRTMAQQNRYARFDEGKGAISRAMYAYTGDLSNRVQNIGNAITIMSNRDAAASYTTFPADVTRSIDEKIDDGIATSGKLRGSQGLDIITAGLTVCFTGNGVYTTEEEKDVCRIIYEFGL